MTNRLKHSWRKLRGTVSGLDSSRQLASGVTLGMMIGLIPKDSLFVLVFVMILLFSRANLLTACCSVVFFSFISGWIVPITHAIGLCVLQWGLLEPVWAGLIEQPLMAWTRFNNTCVMGSLLLGLATSYPTFRISEKYFSTYGAKLFDRIRESQPISWLVGPSKTGLNEAQA